MNNKYLALFLVPLLLAPIITGTSTVSGKPLGEKTKVMIYLNVNMNHRIIQHIKDKYYSRIEKLNSWTEIDNTLDSMRKAIYKYVSSETDPYFREMSRFIKAYGGEPLRYIRTIVAMSAIIPSDLIPILASHPLVKEVRKPIWVKIQLDVAAKAIYADTWWNNGYTGADDISEYKNDSVQGIEVAVLDTGIDEDNTYLTGKIIDARDFTNDGTPDDLNGHGTFVAGIIASTHSTYRGIAYGANLINAKCLNVSGIGQEDWVEKAIEWAITGATDTAEIINTSFGAPDTPDGQSSLTKYIDSMIDLYDVAWATAAGNQDPNTGSLQLNIPGDSFNAITVGAIYDKDTVSRSDDEWAYFSCIGPTTDGRIKPDVAAPGHYIWSTVPGNNFKQESGTSFSTPMVAGALALLTPFVIKRYTAKWNLLAKALLINSADDWSENGPGNDGPDDYTGWGYINLLNLWNSKDYGFLAQISDGETQDYTVYFEEGAKAKITLAWNRRYLGGVFKDFYDLTDLSVQVYNSSGQLIDFNYYESGNVRQVVFLANYTDYYIVKVHADYVDLSLSTDYYAIAANAPIYQGIVASDIVLSLVAPDSILDSDIAKVTVTITNDGDETLTDVKLNATSSTMTLYNQTLPINVGTLNPHESKIVDIYLKPINVGTSTVVAEAYYYNDSDLLRSTVQGSITVSDDDTTAPTISDIKIEGMVIIFRSIRIYASVSDNSGIDKVQLYYRVGSSDINDTNYDKILNMTYDAGTGKYYADIPISFSWIGKTIYFKIKAIDADNDRPNDSKTAWSQIQSFEVPTTTNVAIIAAPILLIFIIVVAIKRRK